MFVILNENHSSSGQKKTSDVARFPGINTSAVNRLSVSDELPEAEKYVLIVLEPTTPFLFPPKSEIIPVLKTYFLERGQMMILRRP